jgi:hypothetical protein
MLDTVSSLQHDETLRLSQRLTMELRVFTVRLHRILQPVAIRRRTKEILQGHIVRTVQQLSTNSIRIAGRNAFACATAAVAASQIAFASELKGFGLNPWMHGERDPRRHPGQGDV